MDGTEVRSGTPATLTCKMTGLLANEGLKVTWLNGNGTEITAPGITYDPPNGAVGKFYSDYVKIRFRNFFPSLIALLT